MALLPKHQRATRVVPELAEDHDSCVGAALFYSLILQANTNSRSPALSLALLQWEMEKAHFYAAM